MAADYEGYLAVLKASYDYEPQSEDEIAMQENQVFFLLERADDDWWKVKAKGDSQDSDGPVGLVPAAYLEQAEHTSSVKAIYDYDAANAGELSIKENDVLLAFEQEDDWLLVQNESTGKAGFVPANYVEPSDAGEPATTPITQIVVPDSPPRTSGTYSDPEDLVKATKAKADDIKTWPVTELDKKGKKKKKGTLGIGNGSVFFASESDKTPVQKWPTSDIKASSIEKSKHVRIEIGGSTPTDLGFHAGSKDVAEEIMAKLNSSKQLSSGVSSPSSPKTDPPPATPNTTRKLPPKDGKLQKKKASVHFAPTSPVVIPPREPSEDEEQEHDQPTPDHESAEETGESIIVLYDFDADGDDEMSVREGEQLTVLEKDGDDWWKCRNLRGEEGVVPASYLQVVGADESQPAPEIEEPAPEDNLSAEQEQRDAEQRRREAEQRRREADLQRREAEQLQRDAEQRAKELQLAERERELQKAKDAAAAKAAAAVAADADKRKADSKHQSPVEEPRRNKSSQPKSTPSSGNGSSSSSSNNNNRPKSSPAPSAGMNGVADDSKRAPPPDMVRVWHDRTGQFRVEAAFLGFNKGKLRLHKVNGVIVEVPAEKMSVEDMRYAEKMLSKGMKLPNGPSDDDIPLAILKPDAPRPSSSRTNPPSKKGPSIDWFEFFLSAGCDLDDCTRYAHAFERDKIDESILPDITEATMRSLGLREGDIIRAKKAIQQRKPKSADPRKEQMLNDEMLARQLQEEENVAVRQTAAPAPNIFTGAYGTLKSTRRGRPQPSGKAPPPSVDLDAISTASGHMQRATSPPMTSSSSAPVQPPPRSSSAATPVSGFEDDAWTNRPSSAKPGASSSATSVARTSSAPQVAAPPVSPPTSTIPPKSPPAKVTSPSTGTSLAKTSESDIFDQLARLSELNKSQPKPSPAPAVTAPTPPVAPPVPAAPPIPAAPPASYHAGLGMGNSPSPMSQHMQNQHAGLLPPANGPRGPYAPVPVNQGLLQPLIPVNTGIQGFVPTRPNVLSTMPSQPFLGTTPPPPVQGPMMTGFPGATQANTPSPAPMFTQQTGMHFAGMGLTPPFVQTNPTGFNPTFSQFNSAPPPPVPPLPPSASNMTSPANVFASMKSGTFANENEGSQPQPAERYDILRPTVQPTGWVYQNGFQPGGY